MNDTPSDFAYAPQSPRVAGVYVIRNHVDGRVYVSGDLDVQGAIERDRHALRTRSHRNAALQADWDWYGEAHFSFEVVDTVEVAGASDEELRGELAKRLDAWRHRLQAFGDTGYNARNRGSL